MTDLVGGGMTWEESLVNGVVDAYCTMQAATNAVANFWNGILDDPVTAAFSNLGTAAYRRVCNREPPPPSTTTPGGQCTGVQYTVTGSAQYQDTQKPPQVQTVQFIQVNCPSGIYGPVSCYWRSAGNGFYAVYLRGLDNGGNYAERSVTNLIQPDPAGLGDINATFIRCDGLPDNCGTPSPTPSPPNYNIVNRDVTYIDSNNTSITIPTTFEFKAPIVQVNGEVEIPIVLTYIDPTLNVPINIDAKFNVSTGDISFDFGGSQGNDDRGGDCHDKPTDYKPTQPLPTPPPDANSPDVPKPDDPTTETVIRGVVVTVSAVTRSSTIVFGGAAAPDAYVPDLGLIWFKCRVGSSATAWNGGHRVQSLRQLITCDWPGGAIDWGWSPRPGVEAAITPIRGKTDGSIASP